MKKHLYITLVLVLSFVSGFSNDLLQKAEKAYDSKKYAEAIKAYEQLVEQGYKSFQLYFNLGNAYYRNDQLGKAIYYYELARKIEPNDEDTRINLAIAAGKTIDKIDAKENFFISAMKTNVLSSFSTSTWAWLTILVVFGAALGFFIFVNAGNVTVKRLSFFIASLLVLAFFITYFLGYSAMKSRYENKFAVVLVREIRIMNEPTPMAKTKFTLHEGTKIRVIEKNGDWLLIKLDNGNEGWVKLVDVGVI